MIFSFDKKEEKKFISLFEQHEKNLDYLIYLRSIIIDNPVLLSSDSSFQNDYELKKALIEKLEKTYPYPNSFVKENIIWDTVVLHADDFKNNSYYQLISKVSFNENNWSLENVKRKAYTLCTYQEEYPYGSDYALKMGMAVFKDDYIYPSISLYQEEWMSLNQHEIRTMEVPIALAKGKVLTLGLGLGYYAFMVSNKEEVNEVHIVEMDIELINLFNKYLLPLFPRKEKIHIHKADAFYFIENIKDGDYDYIFSDLWHSVSDGVASYLKLKSVFRHFKYTKCTYWIEDSILSYIRLLIIGLMKDEYYHLDNDYDGLQQTLKSKLKDYRLTYSGDLDSLLSNAGLDGLLFD